MHHYLTLFAVALVAGAGLFIGFLVMWLGWTQLILPVIRAFTEPVSDE